LDLESSNKKLYLLQNDSLKKDAQVMKDHMKELNLKEDKIKNMELKIKEADILISKKHQTVEYEKDYENSLIEKDKIICELKNYINKQNDKDQ